jgi:glutaredoxin 3
MPHSRKSSAATTASSRQPSASASASAHTQRRVVAQRDPSADWLLRQLSTRAKRNTAFFKELVLAQRESPAGDTTHQARLRQALVLLTGGACDASLFANTKTGKLLSASKINAAVKDLSLSYRMDHSRTGAILKQFFRKMEQITQKGASIFHGTVAVAALGTALGAGFAAKKVIDTRVHPKLQTAAANAATALFFLPDLTGNKTFGVAHTVGTNVTDAITKWRSAQLVNAVFEDGISNAKMDSMKKVVRELVTLDEQVAQLVYGGGGGGGGDDETSAAAMLAKLDTFEKTSRTWSNFITRGSVVGTNEKMAKLFRLALRYPSTYTPTILVRDMIDRCGTHNVSGYHFIDSYGNARTSAKEIVAAYIIMHERALRSQKELNETLLPGVAAKASISSAKWKQRRTRSSASSSSASSPASSARTQKRTKPSASSLDTLIHETESVIFSKTYCPFCARAKQLFASHIADGSCRVIELDTCENGDELSRALTQKTQQKTVPNIFIRGNHVGGYDDVVQLKQTQGFVVKSGD